MKRTVGCLMSAILLVLSACAPARVDSPVPPVTPSAAPPARPAPSVGQQIAQLAQQQVGRQYRYAGSNPKKGFDCSGLAWYSHKQLGLSIPRRSIDQFQRSTPVPFSELRAGDLLFFRIHSAKVSHVAIYTGNNRFVHAPSSGQTVEINRLSHPYWRQRLVGAGRFTRH